MVKSFGLLLVLASCAGGQEVNKVALGNTAEFQIPNFFEQKYAMSEFVLVHPDKRQLAKVSGFRRRMNSNCSYTERGLGPGIISCPINSKADYGRYFVRKDGQDFGYFTVLEPEVTDSTTSSTETAVTTGETPNIFTEVDYEIYDNMNSIFSSTESAITEQEIPMISTEAENHTVEAIDSTISRSQTAVTTLENPTLLTKTENKTIDVTDSTFSSTKSTITTQIPLIQTDNLNHTFETVITTEETPLISTEIQSKTIDSEEVTDSTIASKNIVITTQTSPLSLKWTQNRIDFEEEADSTIMSTEMVRTTQETPLTSIGNQNRTIEVINSTFSIRETSITTSKSPVTSTQNKTKRVTESTTSSKEKVITTQETPLTSTKNQNRKIEVSVSTQETPKISTQTQNEIFSHSESPPTYVPSTTRSQINVHINEIQEKMETGNITVIEALEELNTSTVERTIIQPDLDKMNTFLNHIVDEFVLDSNTASETSKVFVSVTSNLISPRTKSVWKENVKNGKEGAENVISLVDKMMTKVLDIETNETMHINITTPEMYVEAVSTNRCDIDITFPAKKGSNYVESQCPKGQNKTRFGGVLYEDIGKLVAMMPDKYTRKALQPTIIGFEQPGFDGKLVINIQTQKGLSDPVCVYLDFSTNKLSTEGCRLISFEYGTVKCECDHLTNFAVLMSPMDIDVRKTNVLGILSMIGCIISIICLLITMTIHRVFRRTISKDQDKITLLMTLCGVLIGTYVVFLVGIDKTEFKVVCTVIAVSLHFLLLTVFLLMLAEGVYHVKLVFKPRAIQPNTKMLVLTSFIFSIMFVGFTTSFSQLEGYGTEKACWLSTETGIKWTFIIPAAMVVAGNIVLTGMILWKINRLKGMDEKKNSEKIKKAIRDVVFLSSIFGFTWIFGLFSVNEDSTAFQYIFVTFNSLQGFFIMIVHCVLNKKVRAVVQTRSQRRKKHLQISEQSSKPTTTLNRTGLKTELHTLSSSDVPSTSQEQKLQIKI